MHAFQALVTVMALAGAAQAFNGDPIVATQPPCGWSGDLS